MSSDDSPNVKAVQACIDNAAELLKGARILSEQNLPRFAYHLAILALEEIGKASILGMEISSKAHARQLPGRISDAKHDHIRKLFWAIWGPSMESEHITGQQVEDNRNLATRLHERRMEGIYVDSTDDSLSIPSDVISAEETTTLLNMVEARLQMEREYDLTSKPDQEVFDRAAWFYTATEDPERRAQIMGRKSLDKLAELKSIRAWIAWLKETFDAAEAQVREVIEREIRRVPDDPDSAHDKWIVTIRLHTDSHSIRQLPLNKWNDNINWIKLRAVSGKKDQLQVDLHARSEVSNGDIWEFGYKVARSFTVALNVATRGYFWFYPPMDDSRHSGRYYERLFDVENKLELRLSRNPSLRLNFGQRNKLDEAALNTVQLCFAMLTHPAEQLERDICQRYLEGMSFISKTDVHMGFEPHGLLAFFRCLRTAMEAYGGVNAAADFPAAVREFVADAFPGFEEADVTRLISVGEGMQNQYTVPEPVTVNDVGLLKILCDVYLLRAFNRLEPERLK